MKNSIKILVLIVLILSSMSASYANENYAVIHPKVANDIFKVWTITFNESLDPKTVNETTVYVTNAFNRNIEVNISLSTDGKSISVTPKQMYVAGIDYELHITNVASINNEVLSPAVKMPFVIVELEKEKPTFVRREQSTPSSNEQQNQNTASNNNTSPFTNGTNQQSVNTQTPSQSPTNQQSTNTTKPQQEKKPEHLTSIRVDVNSLVSHVTVRTSNFVARVQIDGKKMHYKGNNVYELTIPGLKRGDTIKVEAFSSYERGSSIELISHKVK